MDDYTPALPPGFKLQGKCEKASSSSEGKKETDCERQGESSGPRIGVIGPALPPGLKLSGSGTEDSSSSSSDDGDSENDICEETSDRQVSIGPRLPTGFTSADMAEVSPPSVPDDAGDQIGPVPHQGPEIKHSVAEDFERRAQHMKNKLLNKDTEAPAKREEWMTSLPDKMKRKMGVHVEAKSAFSRSRATGEIDNTWVETPAEREQREQEEREGKRHSRKRPIEDDRPSSRDLFMQQQVDEHNKKTKRGESLLELHQKKLEKKKAKEKKKEKKARKKAKKDKKKVKQGPERIPFDRERDLKTNHFDDAMKRSVLKKARGMSSRFSGGDQKYL